MFVGYGGACLFLCRVGSREGREGGDAMSPSEIWMQFWGACALLGFRSKLPLLVWKFSRVWFLVPASASGTDCDKRTGSLLRN